MAGVVAALEADDRIGAAGQPVDELALALVAPLRYDDGNICHDAVLLCAGLKARAALAAFVAEARDWAWLRSEEHRSELTSLMRISYVVSCLRKTRKLHTVRYIRRI